MKRFALAVAATLLGTLQPAAAQAPQEQALAVVKRVFDGMRARDTAAMRTAFHTSARLVLTSTNAQGEPVHRVVPFDQWLASIGRAPGALEERIYDPEVRIDGNLATVWTRYEFFVGENFSHCGYDSFYLARIGAEWKIMQVADTQRRSPEQCGRTGTTAPEKKPTAADTAAIVAVAQKMFDAMLKRDSTAIRDVFAPGGQLFALSANAETPPRSSEFTQFATSIARAQEDLHERMVKPEVRISDNLATIWTWYDFHIGPRFSHCGFDAFQLVRTNQGWKIIQIGYTTRPTPCQQPGD
jgi:hypothetical protein